MMHLSANNQTAGLRRLGLAFLLFLGLTLVGLEPISAAGGNRVKFREKNWIIAPGGNFGKNKLEKGFEGFEDMEHGGFDLWVQHIPEGAKRSWTDLMVSRISLDYFPLQTPKGLNNVDEDIYSLNLSVLFQIRSRNMYRQPFLIPFFGVGAGLYHDRVTIDSPAIGEIDSKTNNLGVLGSVGIFITKIKIFVPIRIIPEIRYHRVSVPDGTTVNVTYQVGIAYWPDPNAD